MGNTSAPAVEKSSGFRNSIWEKILLNYGLYIAMLIIIVIFAFLNSNYLTWNNITNILEQAAYYLVCAVGMTFVLITGEFDLSVGGNLAFLTVLGASIMNHTRNIPLALLAMVGCALLVGLLNGLFVVKIGIPAFIATIATSYVVRGLAAYYTESRTVTGIPTAFTNIAWSRFLGISSLICIALLVFGFFCYLLKFTGYGRKVYACGGNKTASRVMGFNTTWVRISVYLISALCTALGAMMLMSRSGVARSGTAPNLQMECIAAAVIGGTSLTGGHGSLAGTLVGVVLISMITSGLNALGTDAFWQTILTGCIIIFSALLDSYKTRNNT